MLSYVHADQAVRTTPQPAAQVQLVANDDNADSDDELPPSALAQLNRLAEAAHEQAMQAETEPAAEGHPQPLTRWERPLPDYWRNPMLAFAQLLMHE